MKNLLRLDRPDPKKYVVLFYRRRNGAEALCYDRAEYDCAFDAQILRDLVNQNSEKFAIVLRPTIR